jgi:small subunit ribosomal protein S14
MAKKSVTLRNQYRREMVLKQRDLRRDLKKKAINPKVSDEERAEARAKLQSLPRDGCRVRVRNRCQITGRPRGVYSKFMLGRIKLRELAHAALIPGVTKASW